MKQKQRENIKKKESLGRSMVEMLGVLAVIGVLSVGGIAGYKYGMERYQANQALNEMNMASVQLAIQLQQGSNKGVQLVLGEPFETGMLQSVPFGFAYVCGEGKEATKECVEQETRYQLAVMNVPYGVCQQLSENISNLQYYNDMEINGEWDGDCQKDTTNEIAVLFDVAKTATVAASGTTDYYYSSYSPYTTDTEEPNACGESCKESEGKFCNAYSYNCTANEAYDGECLIAANYTKQGAQSRLVASSIAINSWWSAESFCKALGKKMVSLEKLGCNAGIGACNTAKTAQMKADFKTDYHFVWTSSLVGSENACSAYSIRLSTGDVNSVGRIYAYSEALCEDECTTAADCGTGQACVNGACSNSCSADTECRGDEHCERGKCTPNCTTATECDEGQACVEGVCSESCTADTQCRFDEHCEGGKCTPNCATSADCKDSSKPVCNALSGQCEACTLEEQCGNSVYDHCNQTSGKCVKCTADKPYFNGTTCTTCPTATPQWNETTGACEACPSGTFSYGGKCYDGCRSNDDCKGRTDFAKPYCYMYNGYTCSNEFSGPTSSYFSGVCADAAEEIQTSGTVNGRIMYVSRRKMTYWSAERFCKALGKKRVSRDSLGCRGYTTGRSIGMCFSGDDFVNGTGGGGVSGELYELYKQYNANDYYAWLDDDYENSCLAYYVCLSNGRVSAGVRNSYSRVLCE